MNSIEAISWSAMYPPCEDYLKCQWGKYCTYLINQLYHVLCWIFFLMPLFIYFCTGENICASAKIIIISRNVVIAPKQTKHKIQTNSKHTDIHVHTLWIMFQLIIFWLIHFICYLPWYLWLHLFLHNFPAQICGMNEQIKFDISVKDINMIKQKNSMKRKDRKYWHFKEISPIRLIDQNIDCRRKYFFMWSKIDPQKKENWPKIDHLFVFSAKKAPSVVFSSKDKSPKRILWHTGRV